MSGQGTWPVKSQHGNRIDSSRSRPWMPFGRYFISGKSPFGPNQTGSVKVSLSYSAMFCMAEAANTRRARGVAHAAAARLRLDYISRDISVSK